MTKFAEENEVFYCDEHGCWLTPCCENAVNIGWFHTFNIVEKNDEQEQ
jgi:hypothetical protein